MPEYKLQKPMLFVMLGLPGSGKSYVARNLSEVTGAVHLNIDEISTRFYEDYAQRDEVKLLEHMWSVTESFLKNGISVIFDGGASRKRVRYDLSRLAARHKAQCLVVWVQTDTDTCFKRSSNRDKRKIDDKNAYALDAAEFEKAAKVLKRPDDEIYVVVSGKHHFKYQMKGIRTKLIQMEALGRPVETTQIRILTPDPKRSPNQFQHRNARLQ